MKINDIVLKEGKLEATIERQKKTIKTLKQRLAFITSMKRAQLYIAKLHAAHNPKEKNKG